MPTEFFRRLSPAIVPVLLALFVAMAGRAAWRLGATYDEPGHIVSGYSAWRFHDYRLDAEGGLLSTRIGSAGLLGMDLKFPPADDLGWKGANAVGTGFDFFFSSGNDFDVMLHRARTGVILFTLLPLWLIWRWARQLFGAAAGWLALALAVFSPTMLAHGSLATADMIFTGCLLAALSAWWQLWHRVTWGRLLLAAVAGGAAATAKMSGALLLPMLAAMFIARILRDAPIVLAFGHRAWKVRRRPRQIMAIAAVSVVALAGSVVTVWSVYGFRFAAAPAEARDVSLELTWDSVLGQAPMKPAWRPVDDAMQQNNQSVVPASSPVLRLVAWARDHRVLPEGFLWGFALTYDNSLSRPATYLFGKVLPDGSPLFFPAAFVLKTAPVEFLFFGAGVIACFRQGVARKKKSGRQPRWLYRSTPLLVMALVYAAVALRTPFGIGHRHLLPVYPAIFVCAGAAALLFVRPDRRRQRWLALAAVALAGAEAADSIAASPDYLSYFTPLGGGTAQGWRYLTDSSFDWGQGLPALARWLEATAPTRGATPVFLSYFGSDSVDSRRLPVTRLADFRSPSLRNRSVPAHLTGGWFIFGATQFSQVYFSGGRDWLPAGEAQYASYRQIFSQFEQHPELMKRSSAADLMTLGKSYELLQFQRLCYYLRNRRPVEIVGGSLLVFRLSDDEVRAALYAPLETVPAQPAR